ncbi:hypothetical protein SAMN06295885_2373 [Rathayibacter oskolensis]|uniref:Uncharacterized protein n=1 Tax=Rathayibacter oskolensis TaxID=1891671 RepID=A0A1X7P2Y5_9MICO|nr:hypothetical protein SAMN06295885_2373 [Rathayibacter oskolensis]
MSHPHDALPLRVTERFPLPDGRVGVTAWSAADPEQLEQQLRTRAGHPQPEREPGRRLHLARAPIVTIEERQGSGRRLVDPGHEALTDRRWRRALTRSHRPPWLRRLIGPRDLPRTDPPAEGLTSARVQPLTAPEVIPATIWRLKKMYITSGGIVISSTSMKSRFHDDCDCDEKLYSVSCTVAFSSPGRKYRA